MLRLLSRSPRKSRPAKGGTFRPALERLESRDCPSTISLMMACASPGSHLVTLTGQVTNTPTPGGLAVQLGGEVNGTVTTDANGNFTATLPAAALGVVTAATADGQSNTAQTTLTDPGTQITAFNWMEDPGNLYVFTGRVGRGYQGETVNLGGLQSLQGKSTTVDANGNFTYTVQLDGTIDDTGNASAQAVDVWGVNSNLALVWVIETNLGPASPPAGSGMGGG
jgi:hypothetical protein